MRTIVLAAQSTPSGDNCQPWGYTYRDQQLFIEHDNKRAEHPLNPENVSSTIALGCIFEAIDIAASHFFFKARPTITGERSQLAARVDFEFSPELKADPLLHAIPLRTTDRRPYNNGKLEDPAVQQLMGLRAVYPNAQIHLTNQYPKDFWQHVARADHMLFDHYDTLKATLEWTRFSRQEAIAARDGLYYKNLGVSLAEALAIRLMKSSAAFHRVFRTLGLSQQMTATTRKQVKSSAALALITISAHTTSAWIDCGRLAYRSWLMLANSGYGVQPLSASSIGLYCTLFLKTPSPMRPEEIDRLKEGLEILRKTFATEAQAIPLWLFRTGRSTPLPREQRTLRRIPEDIFKII